MANEIYSSSWWGEGVCTNTIDWGSSYKALANCTPSFSNLYSLNFDGVDDYVSIPSITYSGAFSISLWINPVDFTLQFICGKNASNQNYVWAQTSTLLWFTAGGTATSFTESGGNDFVAGQWQNLIITRDGSNNVNVYRNGVAYGSTTTNAGAFTLDTIGKAGATASWIYHGNIDEVAIWTSDQTANISTISTSPVEDLTSLSPVAWYRNGDNGTWARPQWLIPSNENKDKVSNYSFAFDGVDDEINCGSDSSMHNPNFTISVWVYPTSISGIGNIAQNTTGAFSGATYGFRVLRASSHYAFYIGDGSGYNPVQISSAVVLNTWQHLVMTYDGTNSKYYLDGLLKTTASVSNISYGVAPYNNFYIGTKGGSERFTGNIDEVSLFSNALTQADITAIYNSGTPTTITGAVAHWKMGENSTFVGGNWTVEDVVGSNDGTSANMTIEDRTGDAPNSTSNALSLNMDEVDRETDVPT